MTRFLSKRTTIKPKIEFTRKVPRPGFLPQVGGSYDKLQYPGDF
jgi:hypothetical protein